MRMGRPNVEIRSAKAFLERVNEKFLACDSQRRALRLYNFPHRSPGLTANKLAKRSVQWTPQEGFIVLEAAAGDRWGVDCYRDGGSCGTIPEDMSL